MLLLKCNRFGFLHYVYPIYYFLIITIACYKLHFTICQFNCVCSPCLPWPLAAYTLKKRACTSTRKSKKVILRTELPSKHKAKNKTYSKLVIMHQSFTTWVFLETITLFGLLFFFLAMPCELRDLSFLNGNWTQAPAVKALSIDHWTSREFLETDILNRLTVIPRKSQ